MSRKLTRYMLCAGLLAMPGALGAQNPYFSDPDLYVFPDVSIEGSRLVLDRIDSNASGTLTYHYRIAAHEANDAGIDEVLLDVSTTRALGRLLADRPLYFIGDGTGPASVTVGQTLQGIHDVPDSWLSGITTEGWLTLLSDGDYVYSLNPIPPGGIGAFSIESDFLPVPRTYKLEPEYPHTCCPYPEGDPRNDPVNAAYRAGWEFQVGGQVPAPGREPSTLTVTVLQGDLAAACATLGWITNAGICNSLQVKLDAAQANMNAGNTTAASNELNAFAHELDALNVKFISREAYWMLKISAAYLAGTLEMGEH